MTLDDFSMLVGEFVVGGPIPVRFEVVYKDTEADEYMLRVAMDVIDVEDGVTPMVASEDHQIDFSMSDAEVLQWCRTLAHRMYVHECDEWFRWNGQRVVDMKLSHAEVTP